MPSCNAAIKSRKVPEINRGGGKSLIMNMLCGNMMRRLQKIDLSKPVPNSGFHHFLFYARTT